MDLFTESFGYSPSDVKSLMVWLTSACLIVFFLLFLSGSYQRLLKGDQNFLDVFAGAAICLALITYIVVVFF